MLKQVLASLSLSTLALAGSAAAQCFSGPDGLSGPCWQPTTTNLPAFPAVQLPGTSICWDDCQPNQLCNQVSWNTPVEVACGVYEAPIRVADCFGNDLLEGRLRLDYTRTWDEAGGTAAPTLYQCYRFVAKVDLRRTSTAVQPCYMPNSLATQPTAFYYGYVDYAFDCATGTPSATLVLFHNCDAFINHPLSKTAGTFDPDLSYAIVAPSTAANPFVATIAPPPTGPMLGEAMRNVASPGQPCVTEEPIANGRVDSLGAGCGCELAPTIPQLTARRIEGEGACPGPFGPSSFLSANATPSFPWLHMMTTAIGTWTTDVTYPGREFAWVDEVPLLYRDGCDQAAYGEVHYGASTSGGYDPIATPTNPITPNFTDLASNTSWKVPGPPPSTFMGCVLPSRHLIYFNL